MASLYLVRLFICYKRFKTQFLYAFNIIWSFQGFSSSSNQMCKSALRKARFRIVITSCKSYRNLIKWLKWLHLYLLSLSFLWKNIFPSYSPEGLWLCLCLCFYRKLCKYIYHIELRTIIIKHILAIQFRGSQMKS